MRPRAAAALPLLALTPSCGAEAGPPATFDDVFREERTVVLEEPASAPIGDLHAHSAGDGLWALLDRQSAELRLHDPRDGRLLGRPAQAGEGPGELRQPLDVAIHDGVIWVADAGASELQGFGTAGGEVRSLAVPGGTAKRVIATPRGLLVGTTDPLQPRLSLIDPATSAVLGRFVLQDSATLGIPYWGGLMDHPAAVFGDDVVAAMNLRYPLVRVGADGVERPFGMAPPSWREARVPEYGEFAGLEGQRKRLPVYLESFTTIERLDALDDRLLLVTHGGFETGRDRSSGAPFRRVPRSIDGYAPDGTRLWTDIPLPGRVLGAAADTLFLVTSEPPPGWTLTLYTLRR